LWQEAFRSVEDVHNLLTMAKKSPKPAMMAGYYEKLTKIFLMSGNALYHAAAWGRYYSIVTAAGGRSEEEMRRLAGQVLISALAVPVGQQTDEGVTMEDGKGKSSRLTSLLGLSRVPTRAGLLKDALSRNVHKLAPETIKSLYNILEVTFDPLTLCSSLAPFLHTLSEDASYSRYLPLLQRALLSRLLSQLSQVYSSIRVSSLLDLLAPLRDAGLSSDNTYMEEGIEAYIMGCARRSELNVRVDHSSGSITFVDDPFLSTDDSYSSTSVLSHETPIQPSTTDLIRTRLSSLAICLHNSLAVIHPQANVPSEEEQQSKFSALAAAAHAERRALQMRRSLIVRRRELISELALRREKEEASRRAEISRREKEEEGRKALEDIRRREMERARKEIENIRNEEARKLAQSLNERGNVTVHIDVSLGFFNVVATNIFCCAIGHGEHQHRCSYADARRAVGKEKARVGSAHARNRQTIGSRRARIPEGREAFTGQGLRVTAGERQSNLRSYSKRSARKLQDRT
jgi:translation initiation factor 3 subunit A